jgi:hypothetical protein
MYALLLADPATGRVGEIDVSFAVPFEAGDERAAFEQLLTVTPALDQLVSTVKYYGRKKHAGMETVLAVLFGVLVGGALGLVCLAPIGLPWSILAGAAAGLLAAPGALRRIRPRHVTFHS